MVLLGEGLFQGLTARGVPVMALPLRKAVVLAARDRAPINGAKAGAMTVE